MKRKNKDIILFIILIPLFLWGAFYISSRLDDQLPPFSVINKSRQGSSVFYEALSRLNYPVERTLNAIERISPAHLQIVAHNSNFDVNSEKVKQWVKSGGTLVFLAPVSIELINFGDPLEEKGDIQLYKYFAGRIIVADAYHTTNGTLLQDTDGAYQLLNEIGSSQYDKIYFNETHLFAEAHQRSLWDYIPVGVKFILYQLLIAVMAFIYYKSKRFGKTIPLYEEVERTENEYLYSAAALYRQAGCWDLMLESYYTDFLRLLKLGHDSWLKYWEKEQLPYLNKAQTVYVFMSKPNKNQKYSIQIISTIEQLKATVRERRDSYWRTIRK